MAANKQYSTNAKIQESIVTTKAMVDFQFLKRKVNLYVDVYNCEACAVPNCQDNYDSFMANVTIVPGVCREGLVVQDSLCWRP